jgi:hypothetical protein
MHPNSISNRLLGLGKTNSRVADIVDRVPPPEEGVSEDGKGAYGLREVHAEEGRDTRSLNLKNVVVSTDGEVVAGQSEGEVGQTVTLVALNGVLAVVGLLSTDLLVQELGDGGGEGNEGCAGVKNDTSVVHLSGLLAEGDGIEIDLPVGLAPQWDLGHLAGVVALVDSTEGSNRLLARVGVAEVEGENGLVKKTLVEHVVEGRNDLVDGDGVVAETHDAVEAAKGKGKTGLRCGLGKVLVLDLEVANLEDIVGDEAAELTGAVADLERGAVLLVGRRGRRVVLAVEVAGDRVALGRGNPEVGGSSVENDLEVLRRGTEGNLREVWCC